MATKKVVVQIQQRKFEWLNQVYVVKNACLKRPYSHLLDEWWMQNDDSTDLLTCRIAKLYPLPSFYHNCIMFQLATITNNTPNFQWLIIKSNVSYLQENVTNITKWILCIG
jgi:hypothetical protein